MKTRSIYLRHWARVRRHKALQKLGGKCVQCGESDLRVLEFDHIVPLKRRSTNRRPNVQQVVAEIMALDTPAKKFQVLCCNCHRLKTRENEEYGAGGTSSC